MDLDRLIKQQIRRQLYNQAYQQKIKQKKQEDDKPKKSLGRPPKIEINKAVIAEFTPKKKGRPPKQETIAPAKQIEVQVKPPKKATTETNKSIEKRGSGMSGGSRLIIGC